MRYWWYWYIGNIWSIYCLNMIETVLTYHLYDIKGVQGVLISNFRRFWLRGAVSIFFSFLQISVQVDNFSWELSYPDIWLFPVLKSADNDLWWLLVSRGDGQTRKKSQACKHCLRTIFAKIVDILYKQQIFGNF